jgi:hypothetical protein
LSKRWLARFRARKNGIQQKDIMKYLLIITAALALISTASAKSRPAASDCCKGGACSKAQSACCKK